MDKDRIEGAAQVARGAIKEALGKVTGDGKVAAEGLADKVAGTARGEAAATRDRPHDATRHDASSK